MEMYIAPIVGFSDEFMGSVYVLGHEDDDSCVFSRQGNDDETFYRLIRFEHCGGAANHTDVSISLAYTDSCGEPSGILPIFSQHYYLSQSYLTQYRMFHTHF